MTKTFYGDMDDVRGTIIGGDAHPYEFWTYPHPQFGFRNCIVKQWFINDEEAIAWFKENYPAEYASGVEMRAWD